MIVVCHSVDSSRLDEVWCRLQRIVEADSERALSQAALDDATISILEQTVGYLEAEATTRQHRRTISVDEARSLLAPNETNRPIKQEMAERYARAIEFDAGHHVEKE